MIEFVRIVGLRSLRLAGARIRHGRYRREYGKSTPEPYRLIRVDPADVDHRVYPYFEREFSEYGTYIVGGGWDRSASSHIVGYSPERFTLVLPLEESLFFATVREWLNGETEWEATDWYRHDRRFKGEENAVDRHEKLDRLSTEIGSGRYRTQAELLERSSADVSVQERMLLPPEHFEVEVAIGRDGEIFFNDGKHRFAVAKYSGTDEIPVRVLVRHERWQEIRQEIAEASSETELSQNAKRHLDHTDMKDVTDDGRFSAQ